MATARKVEKQRRSKRPRRRSEAEEELALAEEILRVGRRDQPILEAGFDRFMKQLGIDHVKPIGAKKLREMMLARGFDPNSNEFSRGIVEMREE